jgi:hypothetical protein
MRSIFATALLAIANASNVHDFFAESNFICGICQQAVDYAKKGDTESLSTLYEMFPALETRISAFNGNDDLINLSNAEVTCQNLSLCAKENVLELLHAEYPVDLTSTVEYVNSHPNATWKAAVNPKFAGASQKEIKKIMGTVVDP